MVELKKVLLEDIEPTNSASPGKARQQTLIELGQIQPVRLRRHEDGKYEIVDGRRRVSAMQANGDEEVLALIDTVSDTVADLQALALNMSRSPSPMLEARKLSSLLERGRSQKDLARELGISQSLISQRLSLLNLISVLQDALEEGEISLQTAKVAVKLTKEDQLLLYGNNDRITLKVTKEMLRSYQADMIDLSQIDIPTVGFNLTISEVQMDELKTGTTIIEIKGKRYEIREVARKLGM